LHVDDEKAASVAVYGVEIGGFGLQVLDQLLEDFLHFAGADGGVAGIDGKRELDHDPHDLPPRRLSGRPMAGASGRSCATAHAPARRIGGRPRRGISIAGQRFMTTLSPAISARAAAASSRTSSCIHTTLAPTVIASSTTPPANSERRNTSTMSTGSGTSASAA